jgi:peptidoglycan/LPS O-acetylase OafA/YrhL
MNDKNNNFTFIRLVAALMVLITHSFTLVYGGVAEEPFRKVSLISIGTIAVSMFFIISGYLVTGSLLNSKNIKRYILARVLRIYPALWVMLLITVFLVFPFLSSYSLREYFSSGDLYTYFAKCAVLFFNVEFSVPGVFTTNPYANNVNGSLWTLPVEIYMYLSLLALWVVAILGGKIFSRQIEQVFRFIVLITACILILVLFVYIFNSTRINDFFVLVILFYLGAVMKAFQSSIVLTAKIFIPLLVILVVALFANKLVFVWLLVFILPYCLLYLAYLPIKGLNVFKRGGDYSYGIYIYAFPVQQSIVYLWPSVSIFQLTILATLVSFIFAIFSWHLIEKPCKSLVSRRSSSS